MIKGDIRDRDTVERAIDGKDLVFHEAALVSVDKSVKRPTLSHATNATPTLSVLETARENNVRVVLVSSAAIYDRPQSIPVAESDPKRPNSPFTVSINPIWIIRHGRTTISMDSKRLFSAISTCRVRDSEGDRTAASSVSSRTSW